MGGWDRAETCELVGLYMLSHLQSLGVELGLYRDDGLGVSYKTPRQTNNMTNKIFNVFSDNGLQITIDVNLKIVNCET